MEENKKITVPNASVGAGAGRSSDLKSDTIIPDNPTPVKDGTPKAKELARLLTKTADVILNEVYPPIIPIIEDFLFPGTYLFVGAPKVGKSFAMLQIAYCVSTGSDLWEFKADKGTVLYLALEDNYPRLQKRLNRMFGKAMCNDKLHIAITSEALGKGLEDQVELFLDEHEDTRLVIIDTLQKIREGDAQSEKMSYQKDYATITALKKISDKKNICILTVHHTRKLFSSDIMDMISGTNGLLGAADGAFILTKRRGKTRGKLDITGRDQPDMQIALEKNTKNLQWDFVEKKCETWDDEIDPIIKAVIEFMTEENPRWTGSYADLIKAIGSDIKPNQLSRKLNEQERTLLDNGIKCQFHKKNTGMIIGLNLILESEESDDEDD